MACDHERFQTHCRFCHKIFEGDSVSEAITRVEEHERSECVKRQLKAKAAKASNAV